MLAFAPHRQVWAAVVLLFVFVSCSKSDHGPVEPPDPDNNIPTANDSMFFLFKDQYLWQDAIPDSATFKPNSYSDLEDMMEALKGYKKDGGKALDKYSFLDKGAVEGQIGGGVAGDFGLDIGYNKEDDDLRVVYVYEGSPAYQKGIRRTWRITAVNGDANIAYDPNSDDGGPNVERVGEAVYGSNNVTLTFKKTDGTSATIDLAVANYNINPVLYSNVLNLGSRKVGYFVFNQFIDKAKTQAKVDAVFDDFISKNITDLVVDLRYNGGGSVETAEYLANLIAPASVGSNKKSVMYKETFNAKITAHQYSNYLAKKMLPPPDHDYSYGDLFDFYVDNATAYFSKAKSLNLSKVVFIGSQSTASASELLINVLKPYMDVKLVGRQTFGKPVGFINVPVGGWDMYAVSIQSKNSQGEGDYFNGIAINDSPSEVYKYEDFSKDWGVTSEPFLHRALMMAGIPESELGRLAPATEELRLLRDRPMPEHGFKGMIETRIKLDHLP